MYENERLKEIVNIVKMKKFITVTELIEQLGVSPATIRRDINKLSAQNLIVKIRGGVKCIDMAGSQENEIFPEEQLTASECFMDSVMWNRAGKEEIAKKAAALVKDGDTIFIEFGPITYYMIDYLNVKSITVISNGFVHLQKVINKKMNVFLLEGEMVSHNDMIYFSDEAMMTLQGLGINKVFMETDGIDKNGGYTTWGILECNMKKALMALSCEKYILADKEKDGKVYSMKFADYNQCKIIR